MVKRNRAIVQVRRLAVQQHNVGTNKKLSSFTVVETMVVIVIASILIISAIPNLSTMLRNNQANIAAGKLLASLNLAKAEAIKEGIPVSICQVDLSSAFSTSSAPTETAQQYACGTSTTWDSWKVYQDPGFSATENYDAGWGVWPVIEYATVEPSGIITVNSGSRITFDQLGFANTAPDTTRTGWSWSSSVSSGEWSWGYTYTSSNTSNEPTKVFTIVPTGCTGNNAITLRIYQSGVIERSLTAC